MGTQKAIMVKMYFVRKTRPKESMIVVGTLALGEKASQLKKAKKKEKEKKKAKAYLFGLIFDHAVSMA